MSKEEQIREKLEELFVHVAAMPWKDEGFTRNEAQKKAAKDHIIEHITNEITRIFKNV